MKKHKSKMSWKMARIVSKEAGDSATFINTDGTEGTTTLQQDVYEDVPIRQHGVYPEQTKNEGRINEKESFSDRDLFLLAVGFSYLGLCLTFLWNHLGYKTPNDFDGSCGEF